jgi:hypothetical protein
MMRCNRCKRLSWSVEEEDEEEEEEESCGRSAS